MLTAVVTKEGCNLLECTPEIFLDDEDFVRVLESVDLAATIVEFFKRPVCIGRLGAEVKKGISYRERELGEQGTELEDGEEALSFYEQIS